MMISGQRPKAKVQGSKLAARACLLAFALVLSGCVALPVKVAVPALLQSSPPPMRWDHHPEAAEWTAAALMAVASADASLAGSVPADIENWCPGYNRASIDKRRAFWAGLMSALAKYESGWNPRASGGGGKWIGLMQISPQTAERNGCEATSSAALKDGTANLACAVRVFSKDVAKDGLVAGTGNKGLGRQWMPFRVASKRAEMAAWTSAQPYCQ